MAQGSRSNIADAAGGDTVVVSPPTWPGLSARAREQIAEVRRAVAAFDTPEAADAAGFQPVFGIIPTMGEHWLHVPRMMDPVTLPEPEQLLFSPVNGRMRLVGVAYAFAGDVADAPDLFDGDHDVWHAHSDIELGFAPCQPLVMLHLWFVPSPDGPFAGHDPFLPYWAARLQPPDSAMSDPASAARTRRLALALAEAAEPLQLVMMEGITPPASVAAWRDSLRALLPRLHAARRAADASAWRRTADAAVALWEQVRDAYLRAVPLETSRRSLAAFYREMETGGHGAADAGAPAHPHGD